MKSVKKILLILTMIIIVIIFLAYLLQLLLIISDDDYSIGKDTIESFGNGRYQIIRFYDENRNINKTLYDLKENETIESNIYTYSERLIDNTVYIVGEDGYCILNYEKEEYIQSNDLSDFSYEQQKIFDPTR